MATASDPPKATPPARPSYVMSADDFEELEVVNSALLSYAQAKGDRALIGYHQRIKHIILKSVILTENHK